MAIAHSIFPCDSMPPRSKKRWTQGISGSVNLKANLLGFDKADGFKLGSLGLTIGMPQMPVPQVNIE
jgi:hypothetical protein